MSGYLLLRRKDYDSSAGGIPPAIQRKATWAQVLLGTRGRTPSVKGTSGFNARWRRTPVQGSHFYLWWIPASESGMPLNGWQRDDVSGTILVHSIRHHDQTDDPIDVGAPSDYEEAPLALLDPRYDEQIAISDQVIYEQATLSTIKGLPGSGKSVSLLYLAKDLTELPGVRKIRYVTYTQRLKRAAKEIIAAHGPELAQRLTVHTINEVVGSITGVTIPDEPFAEAREFVKWLDMQNPTTLGPWKRYPLTLYTEVRAYLFGRTFPPGYQLPAGRLDQLRLRGSHFDVSAYAASRDLNPQLAELAANLAQRLRTSHYFVDQIAAHRALEMIQEGDYPRWLAESDAIVVDEVQDLTLLQIALVGEMARLRLLKDRKTPFSFTVAGDESQIVQPSGFDWGVTKDLLAEQVGAFPHDHDFRHQRRSPLHLARLIDNSWNFYAHLPKQLRPSARRQSFDLAELALADEETVDNGLVIICPPPDDASATQSWQALLAELTDKPGRIVVDLSERLANLLPQTTDDESEEVIFLPREIKGLERATIIVYGLEALYRKALDFCRDQGGLHIPLLEARRLFDEMRVALSRSTNRLVLIAPPDAQVFGELGLDAQQGCLHMNWNELIEFLAADDMTEIEIVEGLLDDVDDLVERGRWDQATRRNRRAYDLAIQIGDHALQLEAQSQYIDIHLHGSERQLAQGDLLQAHDFALRARDLAHTTGDPILLDRVDEHWETLDAALTEAIDQRLNRAGELAGQRKLDDAHGAAQQAHQLAGLARARDLSERTAEALAGLSTELAYHLLAERQDEGTSARAEALFAQAAEMMTDAADSTGAAALHLLAERYRRVPQRHDLTQEQIHLVLELAQRYFAIVRPLGVGETAYVAVQQWLNETYASLANRVGLYYRWAITAQELAGLAGYPRLDECLWDLENRLELASGRVEIDSAIDVDRFRAFLAAYNGDAAEASRTWERLGEIDLAIEQARSAGDLERAHTLLRQTRHAMPEDLATAVKAVRLLQQLAQKHHSLQPAERRALLEELARVHASISESLNEAE